MKSARLRLHDEKIRPCREIESIDYDFGESERSLNVIPRVDGMPWKNWICFVYRILNPRFKVIIQRKDVDFQTLVGYIGGYILHSDFSFKLQCVVMGRSLNLCNYIKKKRNLYYLSPHRHR